MAYAEFPGWVKPPLLPYLSRWLNCVFVDCRRTPPQIACCVWPTQGVQPQTETIEVLFLKEEINYLAHQVSKQSVWPSNANLQAITECVLPQTYTEICTFLGLIGHYRQFIKGFTWITQPLNEHLTREGASIKSEWVSLSKDVLEAFQALKQACMSSPILAFANYTKHFLLKTDASKEGLGVVQSQKQADEHYHPVAYGSQALTASFHQTLIPGAEMGHYRTF